MAKQVRGNQSQKQNKDDTPHLLMVKPWCLAGGGVQPGYEESAGRFSRNSDSQLVVVQRWQVGQ